MFKRLICGAIMSLTLLTATLLVINHAQAAVPNTRFYQDWGQGPIDWNGPDKAELEDAIRWELYVGYNDGHQISPKIPGAYYGATLRFDNNITRGEFATALGRCLDIGNDDNFPMGRVDALVGAGIISSKSGDFGVPITRAEMAQWMGKAATKYQADVKNAGVTFPDTSDADIMAAAKTGVIKGYPDGKFHPSDNAKRAHAALMLVRLTKQMNQNPPGDGEIRQLLENYLNSGYEMIKNRHDNKTWETTSMADTTSLRYITSAQEKYEALGRVEDMPPNKLVLDQFKILEKHDNAVVFWYSDNIVSELEQKTFPDFSFGVNHVRKINGRWMITDELSTQKKY